MEQTGPNRRAFLKTSAFAAAPIFALSAPAAVLAADDHSAKLARLEDERSIEALHRKLMRHLNGSQLESGLLANAGAIDLESGLRSIAHDPSHDMVVELSEDGQSAWTKCECSLERQVELKGNSTIEKMARLQGQGVHRHNENRVLAAEFVKGDDNWQIARARLIPARVE